MLKKLLVTNILILLAAVAFAQSKKKSYYIGINGAQSYHSNFDSFEEDLAGLRELYSSENRRIFSAEGKDAKFTLLSSDANKNFMDYLLLRDPQGKVQYVPSRFKESEVASKKNIDQALNSISQQNPEKVTIIYGNHGNPDSLNVVDGELTRKDIASHLAKFPSSTTVQRLHLHCYSGAMLELNEKGESISEVKNIYDLKNFFKENQCALSDAGKDELAAASPVISNYLRINPKATLQDLHAYLLINVQSEPELTSAMLLENFIRIKCESVKTEAAVCTGKCQELKKKCENYEYTRSRTKDLHRALGKITEEYENLFAEFQNDYMQDKHPNEASKYFDALQKYQIYLMCKNGLAEKDVECPKDVEKGNEEVFKAFHGYDSKKEELVRSGKMQKAFERKHKKKLDGFMKEVSNLVGEDIGRIFIRNASNAAGFVSFRKKSDEYTTDLYKYLAAYEAFEDDLYDHPELRDIYKNLQNCEQQPVGSL